MQKEERINQIEQEIARLQNEKRALKGYTQLEIKNAEKLVYPLVCGAYMGLIQKVERRFLSPATLANIVRMILTPEYRFKNEKGINASTYPKLIKNLSQSEYEAICRCTEECIEVIDGYSKELHPYGIAYGEWKEGQSLFKEEK